VLLQDGKQGRMGPSVRIRKDSDTSALIFGKINRPAFMPLGHDPL
jgi:hypothetical protein